MFIEKFKKYQRFVILFWFCSSFLVLCRCVASIFIPLNDTTEARYAEIARKMLETGNWVTLQHDYGVPFWAKPPLSTWLSAASMKVFGINEFAARFPALLLSLFTLGLLWYVVKKQHGDTTAKVTVLVLAGTFYFFLDAGAVMTEPALLFCITLCLVSFWQALHFDSRCWSYLFFVGLGLGLLAKGPIALVLVGVPIFLWVVWRRAWIPLWSKLPWFTGLLLLSAIAFPWYILAEHRTPGFLNYFIVGEHIQRFLTPGWSGDKYGVAHYAPKGMIWLYALIGVMPWTGMFGYWLIKRDVRQNLRSGDSGWLSYVLLFTLVPLFFFTFASNIIYPYVFPILPAFALLFTELWQKNKQTLEPSMWIPYTSLTAGICALVATLVFVYNPNSVANTQKTVVQAWQSLHPSASSTLIYWGQPPAFSAQFYSQGRAKSAANVNELCALTVSDKKLYMAVYTNFLPEMPKELLRKMHFKRLVSLKKNKILLYDGERSAVCQ